MSAKVLKFDIEAREKLLNGMRVVKKAVAVTLSPKGKNVALDKKQSSPHIMHDGVTVAREIELSDPFENMGAQLIKEAASKTNDVAGDGTTTATILTYAMAEGAFKAVQSGGSPTVLRKGMEWAVNQIVAELNRISKKITTPEQRRQVAIVSAQDEVIGGTIAEAIEKVGSDGVVTVDESKTSETTVDYREGMQYDKGFNSPYYITDWNRGEAVLEDVKILVTNYKLQEQDQTVAILDKLQEWGVESVLIIGDYIEGDALVTFVINAQNSNRKIMNIVTTNSPGYAERKRDHLEDIAILTGATLINEDQGMTLDDLQKEHLGTAGKIIADKETTLIVGGGGEPKKIKNRVALIKKMIGHTESDYEKTKYAERLAKLSAGVAIIKVGAMTDTERNEKKEQAIDAVGATQAAIDEGIVPGGEVALLKAAKVLEQCKFEGDELAGVRVVQKAITEPFDQLMENAGLEKEFSVRDIISAGVDYGVDVMDGTLKDLIKAGIIDPVKVPKSALQNAASSAIMAMTTAVLVTDESERKEDK